MMKPVINEEKSVDGQRAHWMQNKYVISVISLLLSVINIYLAVSLELWTEPAGKAVKTAAALTGLLVQYALIGGFLRERERRLRRDATALAGWRYLPELAAQTACLTIPAASGVALLLRGVTRAHGTACREESAQNVWKRGLVYTALIFLCWLPVFLAYYPSVFAYDAEGQLYQVLAHDYNTHHPLLHTLFLGAFFRLGGEVIGSYSAGMAVHSVVQMALLAAAFGYTLSYLYRKGVPAYLRLALLLFYALFPTNAVLAVSTTKDVLFSALALLYTVSVYRLVNCVASVRDVGQGGNATAVSDIGQGENAAAGDCGGRENFRKKDWCMLTLWTVMMLLFRNNAVYALLCSVPCVGLGLYRMERKALCRPEYNDSLPQDSGFREGHGSGDRAGSVWKKYLLCAGAALLLYGACAMALRTATGARSGSPREMLSVPLQQMARTRVVAEESLSDGMRRELERYLPAEWVFAAYDPHLADPVKNRAVIHDDPAGLIRTWIRLGMEYPRIYMDAFLDNSAGYWFVADRSHAQIYGIGTESGFGYLSTDNRTMPAGCEIVEHSYFPALRAGMERIVSDNAYQKAPLLRLVFAPAFYWWMLCMYIAAALYGRRCRFLLPAVFLTAYYMTLLLSPTVLIRYMYPFVVTVPAICCCLSVDMKKL